MFIYDCLDITGSLFQLHSKNILYYSLGDLPKLALVYSNVLASVVLVHMCECVFVYICAYTHYCFSICNFGFHADWLAGSFKSHLNILIEVMPNVRIDKYLQEHIAEINIFRRLYLRSYFWLAWKPLPSKHKKT